MAESQDDETISSERRRAADAERKAFDKSWQDRFAEFAALRDDDAGIAGWSTSGLDTRLRFFRQLWQGAPVDALYADIGCGAGTYSRWLADNGLRVVGVDYSWRTLEKARLRDPQRIAYCAGDATGLPFADASFDGALCFGVLQAVFDSEAVVRELARVIKPGGELWLDALNAHALAARWDMLKRRMSGKPLHLRYEAPRRLRRLMHAAGFDAVRQQWLPIFPRSLHKLQSLCEKAPARRSLHACPWLAAPISHSVVLRGIRSQARVKHTRQG